MKRQPDWHIKIKVNIVDAITDQYSL